MFSPEVMQNFMQALSMMGRGMLGIFVVISIIALLVYFLGKTGKSKEPPQ